MIRYDVLNDYGLKAEDSPKSLTVSPYWVIAIFNLEFPATYNRNASNFIGPEEGVAVRSVPLIFVDDCASLSIQSTKSNHTGTLAASLYPHKQYLSLINPGDYIFAWVVDTKEAVLDIIQRIVAKKPCNKFEDGLKFYGKINSMRESITQEEGGTRFARFALNANSFTELDATFFYEEHLSTLQSGIATQLKHLNLNLDQLVEQDDNKAKGLIPNKIIVALIDVFLGKGVKKNLESGFTDAELKSTFGAEGDYSHILPADVGLLLNKPIKSGRVLKTADVLETLTGVQKYSSGSLVGGGYNNPDNTLVADSRRDTGIDLLGRNSPIPPNLINQSLWSVCTQYLNTSCNEMYATLRTNPDGETVPTVVVRQIPFTTEAYQGELEVTKFRDVPRWVIPELMVRSADVGRSDALRVNFIHVYGTSDTANARDTTKQIVDAPPYYDEADIARSGLRPFMATMPCLVDDTRSDNAGGSGPKKWMELIQDYMMGHHMTLTGNLTVVGIYSPICIGDNVEWDGNIYHIEAISHNCQISPSGPKRFTTTLSLTNGVTLKDFESQRTDISLYARVNGENSTFIPPNNIDSVFNDPETPVSNEDENKITVTSVDVTTP